MAPKATLAPSSYGVDDTIGCLESSFTSSPFRTRLALKQQTQILASLDALNARDFDQRMATKLETAGRNWVKTQVKKVAKPQLPPGPIHRRVQLDILKALHKSFTSKALNPLFSAGDDEPAAIHIKQADAFVTNAIEKAKKQRYSIAFCGMVKAGKSLFLNALIGRVVLPSDNLPSTAWPCRVRHVKGRSVPLLELDMIPFQDAIVKLQSRGYGAMMANFKPPSDDPFSAALAGNSRTATATDARKIEIYNKWVDLHQATKDNLVMFEKKGFRLPAKAKGEVNVATLLGQINDIVRLCRRLDVTFSADPLQWPLLTVEFETLRNMRVDGVFEFIDLPGIGESFADYDFEELITKVAKEIDVIVPVVSLKEVSREDWRHLPELIKNGMGRPADIVVCTHLDQYASSASILKATVSSLFWPSRPDLLNNVLVCSSRLGLSGRLLRRRSAKKMPLFSDIWKENTMEYECAKVILGAGSPESNFKRYTLKDWNRLVDEQIERSGLQKTQDRLTTDIIANAQQRALLSERSRLQQLLRKAISGERRYILALRRSRADCDKAHAEFQRVKPNLQAIFAKRTADVQLQSKPKDRLQKSFGLLDNMNNSLARSNIDATVKVFGVNKVDQNTLAFDQSADAKRFYSSCQERLQSSLMKVRHDYVGLVRDIANGYRIALLAQLRQDVEAVQTDPTLNEFKFEITDILNELSERDGANALINQSIQSRVIKTLRTKYRASTALAQAAIEDASLKPKIKRELNNKDKSPATKMGVVKTVEEERREAVGRLGFMLRAPLVSIVTLPYRLGVNVWLFVRGPKNLQVKADAVAAQLQTNVVNPFISNLKSEGQATLNGMMSASAQTSREIIDASLQREEERFRKEMAMKSPDSSYSQVIPKPLFFATLATLCDSIAAYGALMELQQLSTRRNDVKVGGH